MADVLRRAKGVGQEPGKVGMGLRLAQAGRRWGGPSKPGRHSHFSFCSRQ